MDELDYNYLAELVLKTQRGDSEAFAELYTATYQKQYRFIYRYAKDAYLAQDILQDVYILVLKNINALKNPRLFVSWLNQITFRTCFDVCQKNSRHEEELNHVTEMTQGKGSASAAGFHDTQSGKAAHGSFRPPRTHGFCSRITTAICTGTYHALFQRYEYR